MSRVEFTNEDECRRGDRAPRRRIDLRRSLSAPWRYGIALLVVGAVAAGAWWVGRDRPVPEWISGGLVPALGWIYLLLVAGLALRWLRRRRIARHAEDGRSH